MHLQTHLELANDVVQLTELSELNFFSEHVTLEFLKFLFISLF